MKIISLIYLAAFALLSFASCKTDIKYSHAIRDFKKSLQPYLIEIVSKGIVGYDTVTTFLQKQATFEELEKLGKSEHPVLRAVAFREMLSRPSFNHFEVLMSHLDDTAIVAIDDGEWGTGFRTISDDIIDHGEWKDSLEKDRTIEAVITKYNYLTSAYIILWRIEPQEKYYPYIREMTHKQRNFNEIEYALYGLAKFKKAEDIKIIKEKLLEGTWDLGNMSFQLMEEYPNDAYLEVYEKFYKHHFYGSIGRCGRTDKAINFMKSLATYKNERSCKILATILNKKPFIRSADYADEIKQELVYAIWNNPCKAYETLRQQIEPNVKIYEKNIGRLPAERVTDQPNTQKDPIRRW